MDKLSNTDRATKMIPLDTPGYMDLRGLSKYSSIGVSTLRGYIRYGGLPHFKLNGKILIRISDFNRWVERFRADAGQQLDDIVTDVINDFKVA